MAVVRLFLPTYCHKPERRESKQDSGALDYSRPRRCWIIHSLQSTTCGFVSGPRSAAPPHRPRSCYSPTHSPHQNSRGAARLAPNWTRSSAVCTQRSSPISLNVRFFRFVRCPYVKKSLWSVAVEVQDVGSGDTTRPQREKLIEAARQRAVRRRFSRLSPKRHW